MQKKTIIIDNKDGDGEKNMLENEEWRNSFKK